jgi:cation transport regulator ChaC
MFRYFAYGSVISLAHAREWCASHALDVAPFLAGQPAKLEGYRLVFDVPSRFWQGLVADIVEEPGSVVEGVVFTIEDSARIAVLRKEGVATGLYRELVAPVVIGDAHVDASIFLAEPDKRVAPGPASARYVDALIEGARERGLSSGWQKFLSSTPRDAGKPPPPGISLGMKR